MARITKVELEQQLVASQRDNAALRAEVSVLRAEVARLSAQPLAPQAQPQAAGAAGSAAADWPTAAQAQRVQRVAVQRTTRQLPAHFVAAREAAMRLGRAVKVGGAS